MGRPVSVAFPPTRLGPCRRPRTEPPDKSLQASKGQTRTWDRAPSDPGVSVWAQPSQRERCLDLLNPRRQRGTQCQCPPTSTTSRWSCSCGAQWMSRPSASRGTSPALSLCLYVLQEVNRPSKAAVVSSTSFLLPPHCLRSFSRRPFIHLCPLPPYCSLPDCSVF